MNQSPPHGDINQSCDQVEKKDVSIDHNIQPSNTPNDSLQVQDNILITTSNNIPPAIVQNQLDENVISQPVLKENGNNTNFLLKENTQPDSQPKIKQEPNIITSFESVKQETKKDEEQPIQPKQIKHEENILVSKIDGEDIKEETTQEQNLQTNDLNHKVKQEDIQLHTKQEQSLQHIHNPLQPPIQQINQQNQKISLQQPSLVLNTPQQMGIPPNGIVSQQRIPQQQVQQSPNGIINQNISQQTGVIQPQPIMTASGIIPQSHALKLQLNTPIPQPTVSPQGIQPIPRVPQGGAVPPQPGFHQPQFRYPQQFVGQFRAPFNGNINQRVPLGNYLKFAPVHTVLPPQRVGVTPNGQPPSGMQRCQFRPMFNPVQVDGRFMQYPLQGPPPPSMFQSRPVVRPQVKSAVRHDIPAETQAKLQSMKAASIAKQVMPVRVIEKKEKKVKEEKEEVIPTRKYSFRDRKKSAKIVEEEQLDEYESDSEKKKSTTIKKFLKEPTTEKVVEKILSMKGSDDLDEAEFMVKYKNRSYRDVEWVKGKDLSEVIQPTRLKRFASKYHYNEEDDIFPPEYTLVERILFEKEINGEEYCLVKWGGGLSYLEATWEKKSEIKDQDKLDEYKKFHIPPDPSTVEPPLPDRLWQVQEHPYRHDNTLRSYQMEGLNWLVFNWCRGKGCILADEMGLGKTVQVVAFFEHLRSFQKLPGPFLVVTPLSTLEHWRREINEWTDMNVVVYLGTKENRQLIQHYEWFYLNKDEKEISKQIKFHALITTYEMIMSDYEILSQIHWQVTVVDEAQRLKNKSSKLNKTLTEIPSYHKILLTGTPIQNNIDELWTLLNFINPENFPSLENFHEKFGDAKTADGVKALQTEIQPYLLRRVKGNVEKSIPPKEEILIEVELTLVQKKYYRALYDKNREFLNKGCVGSNVPHLQNLMIQLRKVCNHPFLIPGVEEKEIANPDDPESFAQELIKSSGKMVLLDKLLPKLNADGHKVLIFSQLKGVLDILEKYLSYKKYTYERLDGSVRSNDRQNAIDRFMKGERFVFLLCTRAGGIGINLSEADTVIIYDSDWNPQNDLQAQARCHRIGQKKEVKVYRLVSKNTYERYMFERASMKLGLDQAILSNINNTPGEVNKESEKLSKEDITSLLKYGAYGLLKDDDDKDNNFCEEDIDQIMEKRTSKVVWKGDQVAASSSFSKATFVSETGDVIDLNDEHFWEKVLPKLRTPGQLFRDLEKAFELSTEELLVWLEQNLEEFIIEMKQHIDSIVEAYNEAKGHILPERDTIVKCIELLLTKEDLITEDIVDELKTTLDTLKFSRKKRKNIFIPIDGDEEELKKGKRLKKADMPEEIKKKFYEEIINVGRVDFTVIREKSGIGMEWEQDELRSMAIIFLKQCAAMADKISVNKRYFTQLLEQYHFVKRVRKGGRDDILKQGHVYSLRDDFSWIEESVKKWESKLKYMNRFLKLIGPEKQIPELHSGVHLTNWWTEQCDHELLVGFLKYGFESRELIQEDESLMFYGLLENQSEKSEKKEDEEPKSIQTSYELPTNPVLTKQIKLLISLFDKKKKQEVQMEVEENEIEKENIEVENKKLEEENKNIEEENKVENEKMEEENKVENERNEGDIKNQSDEEQKPDNN
ncbi:hypothetical protein ENUP19_0038G0006 [Entamoeba nuttalli]|uniref:Chromodomain-helicase-DNA-binding protein, putative n=2 Tax=Entamoeba nuttalli TaxID=412467 RepID=K2G8K8_ENTNP|nr:chromodomain-helicase-DNA-binding protein, putative [Entamoeba nuttalli P19]EKE38751.1 chromodomain-helicase-DNA-binding protein, putative [Entamoeba nuttalli P19]|eukprot:XP_008858909.1 chromodomain-helicase-DNA-binding protein, putative [Entamoeba nuttalli P19]